MWSPAVMVFLGALVSFFAVAKGSPLEGSPIRVSNFEERFNRGDAQYLNSKTSRYYIAGTRIPQVSFDVGESYAGLMPLQANNTNATTTDGQQMFFWFFPTVNPAGKDDFVIWFNGCPGCSSLEGFLQENGPFLWKPGTFRPTPNAYSWHKLANVIWVEYPIGTGFSKGPVTAYNNDDTAQQFLAFWKNFNQLFDLKGKNVYLAGGSYAGVRIPFIGAAMIDRNDTQNFKLKGTLAYNAVMPGSAGLGSDQVVLPAFLRYWGNMLAIDPVVRQQIELQAESCGINDYMSRYLAYPPPQAPFPKFDKCDVLGPFFDAQGNANNCFNQYHISDTCPIQWDVLGYPNMPYVPDGASIYFNDKLVRRLIGVSEDGPAWAECSGPVYVGGNDRYDNSIHAQRLKTVVEVTNNVIIGSGLLVMVVAPNVTSLAIQMFEWNGAQGFQERPSQSFVLPTSGQASDIPNLAGQGYSGTTHTERGLTYVTINLAGHMVPQYHPSAAFRHLEVLLGRVKDLSSGDPWSVGISSKYTWPY